MSSARPDVSVVVCHHVDQLWKRCFESLATSTWVTFELIVVSSDPQLAWRGEWFSVIHSTEGPAQKRNLGAAMAKADTLVFLDDDIEVSPYCLWELWKFLQETPRCGMAFAKIRNMERRVELEDQRVA